MINEKEYEKYLEALLGGNRRECHSIVKNLLKTDIDVKDLYVHLFQRALYKVGELWESNKISVATEHVATAITEGVLSLVYPKIFDAEHSGKSAIIACVPNEYHQIGAKMVADTFELNGWDGHFVGADTPIDDLMDKIEEIKPDVLGISLSIYFNMPQLENMITQVRSDFTDIPIWVGGQAFRHGGEEITNKFSNTQLIDSLYKLEKQLHSEL